MIALPSGSKQILYVTGMPRSGSTLLCQLLGMHPAIYSIGHSSPLVSLLVQCRTLLSDNHFLLGQLDVDFDLTYTRMINAYRGLMAGWFAETDLPVVVDKNRLWLALIETVKLLDPQFKLLVCVRELGQVYGSIESQHQKTILLDFIDHLADYDRLGRADQLFAGDKSIGAPLAAIQAVQDLPPLVRDRIFFVRFEDLVGKPIETMAQVYQWMGLTAHRIDPQKLQVRAHESDSHFRHKYLHRQNGRIETPAAHEVPKRVQELIQKACGWYYEWFYPAAVPRKVHSKGNPNEQVLPPDLE